MCGKSILEVSIIGNTAIASDVYKMIIKVPEISREIHPGQFLNVYLKNQSRLLPRPISLCEVQGDTVTLVYGIVGKGTTELSKYSQGDSLIINGPNGNGFILDEFYKFYQNKENPVKEVVLVGGGIGVPPLVELAKRLREKFNYKKMDVKLTAVLGFRDEGFLIEEIKTHCHQVFVATDSGSTGYRGNVLELIKELDVCGDYYFACGPKKMLESLTEHCSNQDSRIPIQVSIEERMGCGYGACVGCTCKVEASAGDEISFLDQASGRKVALKKVCQDGPVFMGKDVIWND